jgi:hypothetical protein
MRVRYYLTVFAGVFLIALITVYAINLLANIPLPNDQYFALYTLGANGTAEDYFPSDQTDILPGTSLSWHVGVYNHMGTVELVKVAFKILNDTMLGPDQLNYTATERLPFFERTRFLLPNETWFFAFDWSVLNATQSATQVSINSLLLNGTRVTQNVAVWAVGGYNLRIVIELWVLDPDSGAYGFQWLSAGQPRVAWNQIWFNMTRTSLLPT